MYRFGILIILFYLSIFDLCLTEETNECQSASDQCSSCIQLPFCKWCFLPKMSQENIPFQRCVGLKENSTCQLPYISADNSMKLIQADPLTDLEHDNKNGEAKKIIQLYPQKLNLKLRKGKPLDIKVKFRQAKDFPLDVYFLMDYTQTMKDVIDDLGKLSRQIREKMTEKTSDVKFGFGSFIDKVLPPFLDAHAERLTYPRCLGCSKPFSFHNNLKLTYDVDLFKKVLDESQLSKNQDKPEGGLDALMQAMVCEQTIGWRKKGEVRRLLIFSTNDYFHHAGEGRLAGIFRPNDEKCHMKNDYYTDYHIYDYPSVGQINKIAKSEQINIIFVVSRNVIKLYQALSKRIANSHAGYLKDNSNILDIIEKQYDKISSEVVLVDNADSRLSIQYFSKCENEKQDLQETNKCENLRVGSEVEFTARITLEECKDGENFEVNITNGVETLSLQITPICECDCHEYNKQYDTCGPNGEQNCGICKCKEGFEGNKCQCKSSELGTRINVEDDSYCREPNSTSVCSGKGSCICGKCKCISEVIQGEYCECDNSNCRPYSCDDPICKPCSGNGDCICGKCKCKPGFTNRFCECRSDAACINPDEPKSSKQVCSGHGTCHCGTCKCDSNTDVLYVGKYCEDCPTCESGKCNKFKPCVQCVKFKSGIYAKNNSCEQYCNSSNHIQSNEISSYLEENANKCEFNDDSTGCAFRFSYKYNSNTKQYDIFTNYPQICPEDLPILIIVGGLISSIVLIGIFTLIIWKIIVTVQYRKEFREFKKKQTDGQKMKNPLYVPSENTYSNPMNG